MTASPDPKAAPTARLQPWIHALGILLGALVVLTIFFGSSVTSMNVGDSDPTWNPLLFLRWWQPAAGGLKVELDHRKFGTFAGVVAVALFVLMLIGERRRSLKVAGLLALVAVCLQGLFGGLRVLATNDPEWSASLVRTFGSTDGVRIAFGMAHGFLAQIILAASLWIVLMTRGEWRRGEARSWAVTGSGATRRWLWTVFAMLCVQLLLGTWLRHARFNSGHWVYT
ncbi:MAG: COX15/CtaA family protein, partial [Planctomycetota bacterium]